MTSPAVTSPQARIPLHSSALFKPSNLCDVYGTLRRPPSPADSPITTSSSRSSSSSARQQPQVCTRAAHVQTDEVEDFRGVTTSPQPARRTSHSRCHAADSPFMAKLCEAEACSRCRGDCNMDDVASELTAISSRRGSTKSPNNSSGTLDVDEAALARSRFSSGSLYRRKRLGGSARTSKRLAQTLSDIDAETAAIPELSRTSTALHAGSSEVPQKIERVSQEEGRASGESTEVGVEQGGYLRKRISGRLSRTFKGLTSQAEKSERAQESRPSLPFGPPEYVQPFWLLRTLHDALRVEIREIQSIIGRDIEQAVYFEAQDVAFLALWTRFEHFVRVIFHVEESCIFALFEEKRTFPGSMAREARTAMYQRVREGMQEVENLRPSVWQSAWEQQTRICMDLVLAHMSLVESLFPKLVREGGNQCGITESLIVKVLQANAHVEPVAIVSLVNVMEGERRDDFVKRYYSGVRGKLRLRGWQKRLERERQRNLGILYRPLR